MQPFGFPVSFVVGAFFGCLVCGCAINVDYILPTLEEFFPRHRWRLDSLNNPGSMPQSCGSSFFPRLPLSLSLSPFISLSLHLPEKHFQIWRQRITDRKRQSTLTLGPQQRNSVLKGSSSGDLSRGRYGEPDRSTRKLRRIFRSPDNSSDAGHFDLSCTRKERYSSIEQRMGRAAKRTGKSGLYPIACTGAGHSDQRAHR